MDELQRGAKVQVDTHPIHNEDIETQSVNTVASRFLNYRVTSRNAFFSRNDEPHAVRGGRQTLLVPDTQRTDDEIFRQTYQSNFTRAAANTVRTDEEDQEIRNDHGSPEVDGQSNGYSTFVGGAQPPIAKYRIVKDTTTAGDERLITQEATTWKNMHSLLFFFCLVIAL